MYCEWDRLLRAPVATDTSATTATTCPIAVASALAAAGAPTASSDLTPAPAELHSSATCLAPRAATACGANLQHHAWDPHASTRDASGSAQHLGLGTNLDGGGAR